MGFPSEISGKRLPRTADRPIELTKDGNQKENKIEIYGCVYQGSPSANDKGMQRLPIADSELHLKIAPIFIFFNLLLVVGQTPYNI